MRLYAAHNGRLLNAGKSLELEEIPAYPGFEQPVVFEIPESLPDAGGACHSTTLQGKRAAGRLILYTSGENMPNAYRKLRPRWKVSYRTSQQMIGSKPVSEVAPGVPGAQYIYATVELPALEPDYVELGRKRPTDGPLVEALDLFIAEAIRSLAKAINDSRRREMDQHALDEVYEENRALNCFKNRFLPSEGNGSNAGASLNGHVSPRGTPEQIRVESSSETGVECGDQAQSIELGWRPGETLRIGCGAALQAGPLLNRESAGRGRKSRGKRGTRVAFERRAHRALRGAERADGLRQRRRACLGAPEKYAEECREEYNAECGDEYGGSEKHGGASGEERAHRVGENRR